MELCFRTLHYWNEMKWNESGFRPPLCTYRLNWARRTSWGWWDDWDDTVLQTQDSKFEPRRSEAEHATSRSRRLPTILTFTRGWGRNNFVSFKPLHYWRNPDWCVLPLSYSGNTTGLRFQAVFKVVWTSSKENIHYWEAVHLTCTKNEYLKLRLDHVKLKLYINHIRLSLHMWMRF